MMMMVTVMAVILHLIKTYGQTPCDVKSLLLPTKMKAENGDVQAISRFTAMAVAGKGEIAIKTSENHISGSKTHAHFSSMDVGANALFHQLISLTRGSLSAVCLAIAILCLSLAGLAQCQDRDSHGGSRTSANAPSPEMRVDINHATTDELLKVPGMTRSWAGRIIRFRPYRTKEDLLDHGVVPSQIYDRIKDYVIAHRDKQ
jgi:DNA uptake protein ComE-like DNA-binding protein